jgi:hypothetical protein
VISPPCKCKFIPQSYNRAYNIRPELSAFETGFQWVTAGLRGISLALTLSSIVQAQDSTPIVTDRPDVTEAAIVVPRLSVQVENGLTWTVQDHQHTVSGTETLLRVGIGQRIELRVEVPDYLLNLSAGRHPDGFNDLSLGLKQQLGPVPGNIQLSIIAATSFPSGTGGISTHGIDPFLKVRGRFRFSGWSSPAPAPRNDLSPQPSTPG